MSSNPREIGTLIVVVLKAVSCLYISDMHLQANVRSEERRVGKECVP